MEKTSLEEVVYDTQIEGEDDEDGGEQVNSGNMNKSGVKRISPEDVVKTEYCIASASMIMDVLTELHGSVCKRAGCGKQLEYKQRYLGTCLVVNWGCSSGHFAGRWASQPTCVNLRAANLLLASAIALSGNSYTKIGFLLKIMNLKYISKNLFNQYQSLLTAPTVAAYWNGMKDELWQEWEGKKVILSADGRNDSPGHSAQYCTYSFADMESKHILGMNIVDVREVEGRKSPNMERLGFERGLDQLLKSKMVLSELVTDSHLEISAVMSKCFN